MLHFFIFYCRYFLYQQSKELYTAPMLVIKNLKARRKMLQVTQETLAELSGVGLRTLKELESGKGNPTLETLQKLADVLGMEVTLQVKQTTGIT